MKNILIALLCLVFSRPGAQTLIEKHIPFAQKEALTINIQIADSIMIIPWDKDEVFVMASVNINDNKDNAKYEWTFNESGREVEVEARLKDKEYWSGKNGDCCCIQSEIFCKVYIPGNARFSVESISGNLIISANTSSIKAKTISGFIDMTMAADRKADLEFKTITGTVFTNFDVKALKHDHTSITNFNTSINGGGIPVSLETISGDIFLRKGE